MKVKNILKELGYDLIGTSIFAIPLGIYLKCCVPEPSKPKTADMYFVRLDSATPANQYDSYYKWIKIEDSVLNTELIKFTEPHTQKEIRTNFTKISNEKRNLYFGLEDRLPE